MKIPENVPKYLNKAVTIFNELITDLRALSVQYENKINGLYALIISLEKVDMSYIEKMRSRNKNPQTAKQKLEARLQICKNMKQVLKNTKKYEDSLMDQQENLLPKSCDIDPLKPHSENLNELTNPYFKKPPTKTVLIPDLLTKYKSTSEVDKPAKMSSSSATTRSITKVTLPQREGMVRSPNEYSTSVTSTTLKRLHPWCKSTRTREEIKNRFAEKTSPAKQQTRTREEIKTRFAEKTSPAKQQTRSTMQSIKPPEQVLISSNSATMEHSEHSEVDQQETSSNAALSDNIQMGIMQKREENITSKNKERVTEHKEVNKADGNESIPQQKANIKYTKQEIHDAAIIQKKLSSVHNMKRLILGEKKQQKTEEKIHHCQKK